MNWVQNFFHAVPYFIALIGLLILVHEAGHFMLAKLFKVKVHVFSLGFGPKLFGFQRKETLYKISAFPIGGYVKMLGEDPTEVVGPEDKGRAFGDKPRWQRFLIILGGPAMNVIFPVFLYFGLELTVTELDPAEIGMVIPGMPADQAGIKPGDIIVAIDGKKVVSFQDLTTLISPNPGKALDVSVKRDGQTITKKVIPRTADRQIVLDEIEHVGIIGVSLGYLPSLVCLNDPKSTVALAGLSSFDLIVAANGKPISKLIDLEHALVNTSSPKVTLEVKSLKKDAMPPFKPFEEQFEKQSKKVEIEIPAGTKALESIGIESPLNYVAYVKPGGAADKIGLKRGDKIMALDRQSLSRQQFYEAISKNPKQERLLSWSRMAEQFEKPFKPTFIPAGKARDLGIKDDAYDSGFWGFIGQETIPAKVPNPNVFQRAIHNAVDDTVRGVKMVGIVLKLLVQGRVSTQSLGGFIMIGQIAGQAGKAGVSNFFEVMGFISLNLGILNLFPIPVLDGGQIVFIGIEAIIRRPLSRMVKERMMLAGVVMVLMLLLYTTWNDIQRLLVG